MCGILGVATVAGSRPSVDDQVVARLRDTMTHRGPDDAGLWSGGNVILAHRRLSVIDPSDAGHQPMTTPDGRWVLIYNGELYNDADLRSQLQSEGVAFRTRCDTETVLHLLARRGPDGLDDMRGMFALAIYDTATRRLLLARDPLGIKPLYWWSGQVGGQTEIVFASEIPAILAHPAVTPEPDVVTVSAYLTTIRTVLGHRTLFQGVSTLSPGEHALIDLNETDPAVDARLGEWTPGDPGGDVREAVRESVRLHLRSDVPTCCLLSGGLDSSIVCHVARESVSELNTFCSGALDAEPIDGIPQSEDFEFARLMAEHLGSTHVESPVGREMFSKRWAWMVQRLGIPLSTPNEVAINQVARTLRGAGNVVTLSGEGADEVFAGYVHPTRLAADHVAAGNDDPGRFHLTSNAWAPLDLKPHLFNSPIWLAIEQDAALVEFYRDEHARCCLPQYGAAPDEHPLQAHLRVHRRINLAGLLQRLDSATMLESVEGRTPFADRRITSLAEALPMDQKFDLRAETTGKVGLRRAFADDLPAAVVTRPKASFPLPFQHWICDTAEVLEHSPLIDELFTVEATSQVGANPTRHWNLAWPMMNIALWGRRWWG